MRLRKVRPLLVVYLLVVGFVVGLLVDRHPLPEPAVAASALATNTGAVSYQVEEDRPTRNGRFYWLDLFRPSREMAGLLLEQAIPMFKGRTAGITPGVLKIYGEPGKPAGLFQAMFPFLQARTDRRPPAASRGVPRDVVPGGTPSQLRFEPVAPAEQANPPAQTTPPVASAPPGAGGTGPVGGTERAPAPAPAHAPDQSPRPAATGDGAGCERPPGVVPVAGGVPLVGIYHTHDYESYISEVPLQPKTTADWLKARVESKDPDHNIIRVGLEIARELCRQGVTVVHSPSVHALPMRYDESYQVSYRTAKYILDQYPTVKVLLDIHRDGGDLDKSTTTVLINGRPAARIMPVVGIGKSAEPNPNVKQNLAWADALDKAMDKKYPGLSRGVARKPYWFNQHLAAGAALLEVGSPRNTMDEALHSARLIADVLSGLLASGQYFR